MNLVILMFFYYDMVLAVLFGIFLNINNFIKKLAIKVSIRYQTKSKIYLQP